MNQLIQMMEVTGAPKPKELNSIGSDENANPNSVPASSNGEGKGTYTNASTPVAECDYDTDPSALYSLIQNKKWEKANARALESPEDCATWVFRKESDGKLRWRLLPIHAAIIFKAPEEIVESLLVSYPTAARCRDDQEMLPIHLAIRNGSSEIIVNLLLMSFPGSVDVKDRKGRVPLGIAQISTSPLRDVYITALKNSGMYYKVAAVSSAADGGVANAASPPAEDIAYKHAMEAEKLNYMTKIANLESELVKASEKSNTLVDHISTIEAQLNSRTDTERFLATKIANLDKQLQESVENKEIIEATEKAKTADVLKEKVELQEKVISLEKEMEELVIQTKEDKVKLNEKQKGNDMWDDRIRLLEAERAAALANSAVMEAQLKKKIKTEHFLASQVKELAGQLADSAADSSDTTNGYVKRIDKLTMENSDLKNSIAILTIKTKTVLSTLDAMADEQLRIIEITAKHEQSVRKIGENYKGFSVEVNRQSQVTEKMRMEREALLSVLNGQINAIDTFEEEKNTLLEKMAVQEGLIHDAEEERGHLQSTIENQQNNMEELRSTIDSIYDQTDDKKKSETEEVKTVEKNDTGAEVDADAQADADADADADAQADEYTTQPVDSVEDTNAAMKEGADCEELLLKKSSGESQSVELLLQEADELAASMPTPPASKENPVKFDDEC